MKHPPKKHLGQHFLEDQIVIERIIQLINPQNTNHMIEIGPGLGALTQSLLPPNVSQLTLIEFDFELVKQLHQWTKNHPKISILAQDVLKVDFSELYTPPESLRIVGNLPYQISTPLIFHLIQFASIIKDMTFMLQKEVVDRLAAVPNTKAYGRLSIMVQYHCKVIPYFTVPPTAFRPKPQVDSAMVSLIPYHPLPHATVNTSHLKEITGEAFNHRRKTLQNALKRFFSPHDFKSIEIDASLRPEALTVREYIALTKLYSSQKN